MKKISILFVAAIAFLSVSCDKDFETVNSDPNNPLEVPAHLLLGNIIRVNQNVIYGMQQGGDMGMCWAQHVSKVQYNDEERYIPRRGAIDGVWDNIYASVISDSKSMYVLADAEGNESLKGISLVMQANGFQILTDLFGPIPFNEVFVSGNFKPKYDSQEVVYTGIIDMLTKADALLASGTGTIPASSDLIYKGDVAKWRKLANSLKLKALMRISKKVNVASQVAALVAGGNLMAGNDDSANITYLVAQPDANPIYETIVFGAREEYKISSVLVEKLQSLNDSRLTVIADKNNAGSYVGNIPGEENTSNYGGFSALGSFYLEPTLPGVILSYSQVQFYLAEAANEGLISGGVSKALEYYNNGIKASFNFNGLSDDAADYIDQPNVIFTNQAQARINIGEQMWISLFGQGFEAWTEWRRTGYPALSPVMQAAQPAIPSRLYYNSNEISLNKDNYAAAVATLTGGDKLTTPLWWMN
ncbi:SusD/RagB family nutrient-binding outer membrane lipoprotein [Flavobacterium sp. TSSA_36]|uniref:SusD/RagB family nutrient-binding outer membrane lipoprotein n=1 Tax=Flavobacterium sp. TSSA_36 TaxID=3447669 RepID=UPI003F2A91E7